MFIKRYRITFLIILALVIWGGGKGLTLQREAQPKVTIPFAYVNTIYVGASPEEVEILITEPIFISAIYYSVYSPTISNWRYARFIYYWL